MEQVSTKRVAKHFEAKKCTPYTVYLRLCQGYRRITYTIGDGVSRKYSSKLFRKEFNIFKGVAQHK